MADLIQTIPLLISPFRTSDLSLNPFDRHLQEAHNAIRMALQQGFDHWLLTFSGGKDSTTTLVLALELALRERLPVQRIDVVYADTLIEIPVLRQHALAFLDFLRKDDRFRSLPLFCHVVTPPLEERFWVCLLGKGYPPPHWKFRWCTKRLKVLPVKRHLEAYIRPNRTVIMTGVRFGESHQRDRQLRQTCSRGGECGQGVWFQYTPQLQVAYLAPIAHWRECNVWDFLNFQAPAWGYPTRSLSRDVYNGQDLRFGCWMCTVVRQDRTLAVLTAHAEHAHLRPLLEFRQYVIRTTAEEQSRYRRPNGTRGRLTLETRRQLLDRLLKLQEHTGLVLITPEEVAAIRALWEDPRYGEYPDRPIRDS